MKPLIVAATQEEIQESIPFLENNHIPYIITGVGMTATAFKLGRELVKYSPDLVINVGITGAIDKNLHLGEVVQISRDTFSELGAEDEEHFISLDDLGFGKTSFQEMGAEILEINLPKVEGITVNTTHGDESSIARIKTLFPNAATESMEGAAVFYACHQEKMSCIQIRSISNYVEKRNKENWNIPLAIKNLNAWLQSFLKM